jgi:hypothetical protein
MSRGLAILIVAAAAGCAASGTASSPATRTAPTTNENSLSSINQFAASPVAAPATEERSTSSREDLTPSPVELAVAPATDPLLAAIEGTWGRPRNGPGCEKERHRIQFSRDQKTMYLTDIDPREQPDAEEVTGVRRYDVLQVKEDRIVIRPVGDDRTAPSGGSVLWELILRDADVYCQRRTDWRPTTCTAPIVRCSGGIDGSD